MAHNVLCDQRNNTSCFASVECNDVVAKLNFV